MGPSERERAAAWATGKKPCAVCRADAACSKAHHIITRQRLRRKAREMGVDPERLLWDTRNRLWLCDRHHAAHHARSKPIGWTVLEQHAPKAFQFAEEVESTLWLERTYPKSDLNQEEQR